ncbi:interferon lambda receptor 1 [Trachinotus anak]|uniref:interferon lambda receptor 1 n=1 Tax=Trachinotus anak TaxID=443729 RepID=UPI0039F1A5F4
MKMWSTNVIVVLLSCYACLSTGNGTVYFVSKNFHNILHWDHVKPATQGEKVLYSVQLWNDVDEQFRIKEGCQNITALTCDLTAETPAAPYVHYKAQVFANGHLFGQTLNRFKPIADTILGPPILSTYTTASSLNVNVILPMGPNGVSVADIIISSKTGPSKAVIIYILKITEPEWAALVDETTTGQFVINLKSKQTKFCGHVIYKPSSEWGRKESEKAPFCVTLQGDHWMLLSWLVSSAALLTALVTISVVWMCYYVKGGKHNNMPKSLVTTSGTLGKAQQTAFSPVIITRAVVSAGPSDKTVYATIQVKPNAPSDRPGGYAPQDILCQDWQGSTFSTVGIGAHSPTLNLHNTSAQSSEIYSAVAIHVPTEESEDFQQAITENRGTCNPPLTSSEELWDKGEMSPNLTLDGLPALPDLEDCESNQARPLLLHTVRSPNGQLMLPSLTLQLESSTDDTLSPLSPERKPLLSDLIDYTKDRPTLTSLQCFDSSEWSDSGCDESTVNTPTQPHCNSNYSPSQPVIPDFHQQCQNTLSSDAISESGYKQNWTPAMYKRQL